MKLTKFACQRKYALEIIEKSGPLGAKAMESPVETNHKLALTIGSCIADPTQYRRLVRRLIYLIITKLKLCHAIYVPSQFMHEPKQEHIKVASRVLRYLKGNQGQRLLLMVDSDL